MGREPVVRSAPPKVRARFAHRPQFHLFRGWWIVAGGFICQMVHAGARGWIFSIVIIPMQRELGWSQSELVGVFTVGSLLTGAISAVLGPIVDRYGSRTFMTVSALLGGLCLISVGYVKDLWLYYLMLGVGIGLAAPGMQALGPVATIANWFVRRRTLAFTIYTLGSPITGIALTPIFAWLTAFAGWRIAWWTLGLLALCVVPIAWLSIRRRPEDVGLLPDGDQPGVRTEATSAAQRSAAMGGRTELHWTVRQALRTRSFWLLVFAFGLVGLPSSSIFVYMSPFVTGKGFSPAEGAFAISIFGMGTLTGRFVWGYVIDRIGIHRSLSGFGFVYGLGIVGYMLPSSVLGIYTMAFVLGLTVAGGQLFQAQTYADYFGRDIVGALTGYSGVLFTVSRAVAPLFAALVFDAMQSYEFAFSVFAAASFASGIAFLLAAPPAHPSERKEEAVSLA